MARQPVTISTLFQMAGKLEFYFMYSITSKTLDTADTNKDVVLMQEDELRDDTMKRTLDAFIHHFSKL